MSSIIGSGYSSFLRGNLINLRGPRRSRKNFNLLNGLNHLTITRDIILMRFHRSKFQDKRLWRHRCWYTPQQVYEILLQNWRVTGPYFTSSISYSYCNGLVKKFHWNNSIMSWRVLDQTMKKQTWILTEHCRISYFWKYRLHIPRNSVSNSSRCRTSNIRYIIVLPSSNS